MFTSALAAIALLAQVAQDPNTHVDKVNGFRISKPPKPKAEEWDIKASGVKFKDSPCTVLHKVDDVIVEINCSEPPTTQGLTSTYYDPKDNLNNLFKQLSTNPSYKEPKKLGEPKSQKIAGTAGYYMEMTFKDKDDKPIEWRAYVFCSKGSQALFTINIVTGKGLYEKYAKEIGFVVGSLATFKPEKK